MNLKSLRKKHKLTQNQLSQATGINEHTLFGYERELREPNIETLVKLADFYHVSVDELIGRPTSIINKLALSDQEREVIEKFLSLTNKQKSLVEIYINTLTKDI